MDVDALFRLKGVVEASTQQPTGRPEQGHVASYPRIRSEVRAAIGSELHDEFDRLFPEQLATHGRPWGVQVPQAIGLITQMAGWLGGTIEAAILQQRIQADAAEKAKLAERRTGFG